MIAPSTQICRTPQRRADVRSHGSNGIDYVEASEHHPTLKIYFLTKVPENLDRANIVIEGPAGGRKVRVLELRLCSVDDPGQDDCMLVLLDQRGDLGEYTIRLVEIDSQGAPTDTPLLGLDARYSEAGFHFDAGVTNDIDCNHSKVCPAQPLPAPDINYLAKDYGSFLQLIYDRLALIMPEWQERHVPDVGVALAEVLAFVGDYLSYYQDAVATDAYLSTARQRISVRRHVRLLDYAMHEGCNARVWLAVNASATVTKLDPAELRFIAGYPGMARGPMLSPKDLDAVPVGSYLVFQPVSPELIDLYPERNQISFYTWGNQQCCLPKGATAATLLQGIPMLGAEGQPPERKNRRRQKNTESYSAPNDYGEGAKPPAQPASSLHLKPGDVLLFKEVVGPETGSPSDADPTHRQFVRLTQVKEDFDRLYDPPMPIVEIEWEKEDALTFDLCISAIGPAEQGCQLLADISVACGNVILADQGAWRGCCEMLGTVPLASVRQQCESLGRPADIVVAAGPFSPTLKVAPLTHRQVPDLSLAAGRALTQNPRAAVPQIRLRSILPLPDGSGPFFSPEEFADPALLASRIANQTDEATQWLVERLSKKTLALLKAFNPQKPIDAALTQALSRFVTEWTPRTDLLGSSPGDADFVVEIDDAGTAHLRFGDGELGRAVQAGEGFFADYRIGNGVEGNVGAESIRCVVIGKDGAVVAGAPSFTPSNPLPAQGGMAAEPVDEVKLFAPGAFLTTPERAITADDYARIAERNRKVQRAAATLLWTGVSYEAHVAIDPKGTDTVDASLLEEIQHYLYRFRRIGHDLVVVPAQYAPLDVAMTVNVDNDYLSGHVRAALLDVFSDRALSSGELGFFHPDNLSFGDNIYLSKLVAAAQAVPGVVNVTVTRLERLGAGPNHELENGFFAVGPLEIAQMDNDPAQPQRGKLTLTLRGGL
jgi:hypothetical protein